MLNQFSRTQLLFGKEGMNRLFFVRDVWYNRETL